MYVFFLPEFILQISFEEEQRTTTAVTQAKQCVLTTSAHSVVRISNAPIPSNQMVSLDVLSLFTKVPTDGNQFQDGIGYISTRRRTGYGFTVVTSIGQHIYRIFGRNGINNHESHLCGLDT